MRKKDLKKQVASLLAAAVVASSIGTNPIPILAKTAPKSETVAKQTSILSQLQQGKLLPNSDKISDLDGSHKESDEVTIIVELKQDPLLEKKNKASARMFGSFSSSTQTLESAHKQAKSQISQLLTPNANQKRSFSVQQSPVTFGYDYYVVMNGFSVKTQFQNLEKIRALSSVKHAYVANSYYMEQPEAPIEKNMANSSKMVGANLANQSGYTGKKTVVSVLDSGLDVHHDAFNSTMPKDVKYQKSDIENLINQKSLSATNPYIDKVYINKKVPYVYDYADQDTDVAPGSGQSSGEHGTHVSGTIAANTEKLQGVAPDAQLMMMKVFSSSSGSTSDDILLAALDDSVKLGADVINMSLGSSAGFSSYSNEIQQTVYQRVQNAGINLAISAGNSNNAAVGNQSGEGLAYATDPDYAIVGSPSTLPAAMSVASMISTHITNAPYFLTGEKKIYFTDASQPSDPKIYDLNGTYPYVYCGVGTAEDFSKAGNVKGKIALVKRGEISFSDKTQNAVTAGAKAIVIMNNQSGALTMQVDAYKIPAVSITQEDGTYLREQKTKKLSFSKEYFGTEENPKGYQMSDFSSWGCAPDLKLKPEITAPGENIYSCVLDNQYSLMSGTSMASPHIAGLFADAKQYLNETYPKLNAQKKYQIANAMLMSTATPTKDTNGEYYSPRKQGAGLANIEDFVRSEAYLSVPDSDKPKAELGYNTDGTYSFRFTVNNLSNKEKTYTLDTSVLLEELTKTGCFSQSCKDKNGDGATVSYDGVTADNQVTVAANKSADITVSIRLTDDCKAQLKQNFPNGNYVEGFVRLLSEDSVDLTLPYLGFFGDWQTVPIFDGSVLDDYHMFGNLVYNKVSNVMDYLGQNLLYKILTGETKIDPSRYVISPDSLQQMCSVLSTQIGLLRNVDHLSYEFTDSKGNVVKRFDYDQVMKSYLYQNQVVTWAEALMYNPPAFDGTDEDGKEVPEGTYTCTVSATAAGTDGSKPDTWSFDFAYDKTPSKVKSYQVTTEDDHTYLSLTVTDNHYLSGYQIVYDNEDVLPAEVTPDPDKTESGKDVVDENGDKVYTLHCDLTPLFEQLKEKNIDPKEVTIDLFDYAMNVTEKKLKLHTDQTADQSSDVSTPSESDDYKIDDNGVLLEYTGINTELTIPEGVKEISTNAISYAQKSKITKVTLPKSLEKIQDYAFSNCTALQKVVVPKDSHLAELGSNAFSYTAIDSFAIPKKLKKLGSRAFYYCGNLNHITLPDDMTEIESYAFGRCTSLDDIHFPEKLKKINEGAFNVTALHDLNLPDSVEEIDNYAFRSCAFESVTLPKSCKRVGAQSFSGCFYLKEWIGNDALTEIGQNAFAEDSALETVKIGPNVELIGSTGSGKKALPSSVFLGCTKLKTLNINKNNRAYTVDDGALFDKKKTTLYAYMCGRTASYFTMPNSVKEIDEQAFYQAVGLKDLVLNEKLETIGAQAFDGCEAIVSFKIPDRVTQIGKGAMQNCTALQNLVIGDSLQSIPKDTFRNDKALKNVVIGRSVETIEPNAFENADEMQYLTLPDSVKTLKYNAFLGCEKLKYVQIGKDMEDLDPTAFSFCNALESFTVSNANTHYADRENVLYSKQYDTLLKYPAAKPNETFKVPDAVKTIACRAFDEAQLLKKVVLSNEVETIEAYAFNDCKSLTSVDLPDSLKSIKDCAFANAGLKRIRIPKNVTSLPWGAFMLNENLTFVDLSQPEQLTLDFGVFTSCSKIKTILVGNNVTSVGFAAIPANKGLTIYTPAGSAMDQYAKTNQIQTVNYNGFTIVTTAETDTVQTGETYQANLMILDAEGAFKISYTVKNAISQEVLSTGELPETENKEDGIPLSYVPEVFGNYDIVISAVDEVQNKAETTLHFEATPETVSYDWQYGDYDTTAALYELSHDTMLAQNSLFRQAKLEISDKEMTAHVQTIGVDQLQYYDGSTFVDAQKEEETFILPMRQDNPSIIVRLSIQGTEVTGRLVFDYANAVFKEKEQEVIPVEDGQYALSGSFYEPDWDETSAYNRFVDKMYLIRKGEQTTLLIQTKPSDGAYLRSLALSSGETAAVIADTNGNPNYLQISLPQTVALTDAVVNIGENDHPIRIFLDFTTLQPNTENLPLS
ncbi:MAG: leucine-rich repeat protein [Lachnospiraceae bacterium]